MSTLPIITPPFVTAPLVTIVTIITACFSASCATQEERPAGTEVRISAAIQADTEGLAGVRLQLNPVQDCTGMSSALFEPSEDSGWSEDLDGTQLIWPDGTPAFDSPSEQTHLLAETGFLDVTPGCYEALAIPLDAAGEPLLRCYGLAVPVEVESYASLVIEPPVFCGQPPRAEADARVNNVPPQVMALTSDPTVCADEVAEVCATAIDADDDLLEFAWSRPTSFPQSATRGPWPTLVYHQLNEDHSVTQCIGVQAGVAAAHEISVEVYDLTRATPHDPPVRVEELIGSRSHGSQSTALDASQSCDAHGRSLVILLTLDNDSGLPEPTAETLIGNAIQWVSEPTMLAPKVLVVLDDNHHGEHASNGEFVHAKLQALGYAADYLLEPPTGLDQGALDGYDVVWFVNPGDAFDDPQTHRALLRHRYQGGALILQGEDIARFRANPSFMTPLTALDWEGDGAVACGLHINEQGERYTVQFNPDTDDKHPVIRGLEGLSFSYAGDLDHTRPLDEGEQVLAWARFQTRTCVVRKPVVVALDPAAPLPE